MHGVCVIDQNCPDGEGRGSIRGRRITGKPGNWLVDTVALTHSHIHTHTHTYIHTRGVWGRVDVIETGSRKSELVADDMVATTT